MKITELRNFLGDQLSEIDEAKSFKSAADHSSFWTRVQGEEQAYITVLEFLAPAKV